MTQSSLQTQCPNCQTRFRVSDEQLGIAKGKVRCGNCMAVFNAIEHQVIPEAPKKAESTPVDRADAPEDQGPSSFTEEDFVFQDNPEEDAAAGQYAGTRLGFSDAELSDSFREVEQGGGSDFHHHDDDHHNESIDESWAEEMLTEPREAEAAPDSVKEEAASFDSAQPLTADRSEDDSFFIEFEEQAGSKKESTPEPAVAEEPEPAPQTQPAPEPEPEQPIADTVSASRPFDDLRREPVSVSGNGGSRLRTLFWTIVVLALIGVLVAQVTWYQFDRLSAIPQLRPFYEKGCELAGCELQPLLNVDEIQSRKLVVRSDPDNRTQLIVDAVIINRAEFEQPFPAIALTFSNLNGDVVAQSVFTPDEYLAGEGSALKAMPKDTPVRIAIQIRDPGRDAVNYNINFRPYTRQGR